MSLYWLVRIDNFDSFISFIIEKFNNFFDDNNLRSFRDYYSIHNTNYLYLCIDIKNLSVYNVLTYCIYNNANNEWLINNNYKYMGEYHGRKEKLEKLNNIFKL